MNMRLMRIEIAAMTIFLVCVGIVMIYSASAIYALETLGDSAYFLKRHLIYVAIGIVCMLGVMRVDYRKLRAMSKPLLLLSIGLLIAVLIPGVGKEVGGAQRWFRFGPVSFQPSELAKLAVIVYTADFLTRKQEKIRSFFEGFFPILIVLGMVAALILLQPDLGTVVAAFSICLLMCFIGGVRVTYLASLVFISFPALYVLIFSVPYRRNRILAFLNPWEDPQGTGFQIIQSLVALGSGGLFGVGLGAGKQKLLYLPAAYTDFIFSIIGEELGFIGAGMLVLLFMFFVIQAARLCLCARDSFGRYLGIGLVSCLAFEAIVNMGVATSLLPTKGLPFPFISYGGTSLMFNMMFVGLILNIGKDQ